MDPDHSKTGKTEKATANMENDLYRDTNCCSGSHPSALEKFVNEEFVNEVPFEEAHSNKSEKDEAVQKHDHGRRTSSDFVGQSGSAGVLDDKVGRKSPNSTNSPPSGKALGSRHEQGSHGFVAKNPTRTGRRAREIKSVPRKERGPSKNGKHARNLNLSCPPDSVSVGPRKTATSGQMPDRRGLSLRTCFSCGSSSHKKAQCPQLRGTRDSRKRDFVHAGFVDELQKMKGENDALRQVIGEMNEVCGPTSEVVATRENTPEDKETCVDEGDSLAEEEPVEPVRPDNQSHKLIGMRWEYDMPAEDFRLISGAVLRFGRIATDVGFLLSYSVWLWVQVLFLYSMALPFAWVIEFIIAYYANFLQVDGRPYLEALEFVWARVDELAALAKANILRHVYIFEGLWRFVSNDEQGFKLFFRLSKRLSYAIIFVQIVVQIERWFPILQIIWIYVWLSPWFIAPILFLFFSNYRRFFVVNHTYELVKVRHDDYVDQRPQSNSLCDIKVPRVASRVEHVSSVHLDFGFVGKFWFCEVVREQLRPNIELAIQMASGVNLFFPDDQTALNFFTKQPSRLQSLNSNRVADIQHTQTAQSSLLAFAVYKDFSRRARLAGAPQ